MKHTHTPFSHRPVHPATRWQRLLLLLLLVGGSSLASYAQVISYMTITDFNPKSGAPGTIVTITGNYIPQYQRLTVTFGGFAPLNVFSLSSTSFTVTVPAGAKTGKIVVTYPDPNPKTGRMINEETSSDFTVLSASTIPTLTNLSPTGAAAGTSIVLTGTNFTGTTAVRFNGTAAASFTVNSATQITATVPAGATSGNVTVTTPSSTSNGQPFTVFTTPVVANVSVPTDGTYGVGRVFDFFVVFNQPVVVTGTPQLLLNIDPSTGIRANFVSVVNNGLRFSYTTTSGLNDVNGIQIASLSLNGGTIKAATGGLDANTTLNGVTSTVGVRVDGLAPTVAISSTASNPTSTSPIPVTVTFSESVTGFAQSDVSVSNASISSFSGSGSTYALSLTPAGTGPVGVNVAAGAAQDAVGNTNTAANAFSTQYNAPAPPDLVINSGGKFGTNFSGTYNSIIINEGGSGVMTGATTVNSSITVKAGGTLSTNCQVLSGPGSFTLEAGGRLVVCSPQGLSSTPGEGAVQVTGARSFSSEADYFYQSAVEQRTGDQLPATVRNLLTGISTVTLSQPLTVTQVVNLSSNLDLAGHTLTLPSTASGTALIVNSGGRVLGNTGTMQRHIETNADGSGYRHYSSPVQDETFATLAAGAYTPNFDGAARYNSSATPGTVTPFPTVFAYDQDRIAGSKSNYSAFDKGFVAPTSGSEAMEVGRGYAVQAPGSILVDFTGTFTTGDVTRTGLDRTGTAGGWHLLGNPYPSPIDWSNLIAGTDASFSLQNLNAAVYVVQSDGPYTGTYRTYLANGPNDPDSSPIIPAGQGFFVRTTTPGISGTLRLRNGHRVTEFGAQPAFGRGGGDARPVVRLTLTSANGKTADKLTLYADAQATAGVDAAYDATKLPNPSGLNLSAVSATGEPLAIDARPAFTSGTSIALRLSVPTAGTYTLSALKVAHLPAGLVAYLRDASTSQQVDLSQQPTTPVSLTAGLNTRYSVVFATANALAAAPALTAAQVALYPNPAGKAASVQVTLPVTAGTRAARATVLNALGQVVATSTLNVQAGQASGTIATSGLASGVYSVRLQAGAETVSKRLVVE